MDNGTATSHCYQIGHVLLDTFVLETPQLDETIVSSPKIPCLLIMIYISYGNRDALRDTNIQKITGYINQEQTICIRWEYDGKGKIRIISRQNKGSARREAGEGQAR